MKKMMRMAVILLLTLLLVPFSVRADVIYEPWDDSFYEDHREECEYHSRSYTTAGPNGDVTVYESPESNWKEAVVSNGETLWISYLYEDGRGILWGFWESFEENIAGWVPMDYLNLIYDGISFEEDYGDRFEEAEETLDEAYRGQTVYFWKYPGSEIYTQFEIYSEDNLPACTTVYTDPEGNRWGRCAYYYGLKGYWINLDSPTADFDTLYPEGIETVPPETEPQPAEHVVEIVPESDGTVKLVVIAVAATVAVTAVLLYLLKKKM